MHFVQAADELEKITALLSGDTGCGGKAPTGVGLAAADHDCSPIAEVPLNPRNAPAHSGALHVCTIANVNMVSMSVPFGLILSTDSSRPTDGWNDDVRRNYTSMSTVLP